MARKSRRLTKAQLDALRSKAAADPGFSTYLADAGQPGLYVQARRGKVAFLFVYRSPGGGARRRMRIDDFGAITLEQARGIAQQHRGAVATGLDPQDERQERQRRALTLQEAADRYLGDLEQRAKTGAKRGKRSGWTSAKRRLEKNILPKLGQLPIRNITVDQVRRVHRGMASRPVEANRSLTALAAVFGFADREGLTPAGLSPSRHVERFEEKGERRALTSKELKALGEAIREAEADGKIHPSAAIAIRFLALTGFRRSELLGHMASERRGRDEGLRWRDVDLDAGLVRLRATKTGAQTRVIGQAAVDLLQAVKPPHAAPGDPVCPAARGDRTKPFNGIDKARRKLYETAKIEGADLHSLRHSFASIGAHTHSGRYASLVAPLLGHGFVTRSVTAKYIHQSNEALRPAADAIADEIAGHLGLEKEQGDVLAFERK